MNKSEIKLIPIPKEVSGTGELFKMKPCIMCEVPQ